MTHRGPRSGWGSVGRGRGRQRGEMKFDSSVTTWVTGGLLVLENQIKSLLMIYVCAQITTRNDNRRVHHKTVCLAFRGRKPMDRKINSTLTIHRPHVDIKSTPLCIIISSYAVFQRSTNTTPIPYDTGVARRFGRNLLKSFFVQEQYDL